jgi:ubiquinone/menaquinone biosynthesis C-methylase UbiE
MPRTRPIARSPEPFAEGDWTRLQLLSAHYQFAKTMPENPHYYTLRKTWSNDAEFVAVVEHMRLYGYPEVFEGKTYTQYPANGFKFWTMGNPIDVTTLINRKPIQNNAPYDAFAAAYDDWFISDSLRRSFGAVIDRLQVRSGMRILDIGCGTGLFYEALRGRGLDVTYVGIDPSDGMLDRFREKTEHRVVVHACKFEHFASGRPFDCIVALNGTASYLSPRAIRHMRRLLVASGSVFLSYYRPGYEPASHVNGGVHVPYYRDVTIPYFVRSSLEVQNEYVNVSGYATVVPAD